MGFIGIGKMGLPMTQNLLRAGTRLLVWNRSKRALSKVQKSGAEVAVSAREVFARTRTVILMLANDAAVDEVFDHGGESFVQTVNGRTIIHMGTTGPSYSRALAMDIHAAGGRYVEAPVSGSVQPARDGRLVVMLAGETADPTCTMDQTHTAGRSK